MMIYVYRPGRGEPEVQSGLPTSRVVAILGQPKRVPMWEQFRGRPCAVFCDEYGVEPNWAATAFWVEEIRRVTRCGPNVQVTIEPLLGPVVVMAK